MGILNLFLLSSLVKQGTVLDPVLNNCSLNKFLTESIEYHYATVQIKSMQLVDDLADLNKDTKSAPVSNSVLDNIQHENSATFSDKMYELLKKNFKGNDYLMVMHQSIPSANIF